MFSLLFVLANLLAVVASLCAAELFFQKREPHRRFLAAVAGFPIVVYAVQMVLGNLGLLRIGPAILLLLALAGPLWLLAWRRSAKGEAGIAAVPPTTIGRRSRVLVAGGRAALRPWRLAFASTCLQGTSFWGDDLVYHATASAKWYQQQKLSLAPHYYSGYYPMNAELFSLWFILPLGRDGMVWMAGAYWTFCSPWRRSSWCGRKDRRPTWRRCAPPWSWRPHRLFGYGLHVHGVRSGGRGLGHGGNGNGDAVRKLASGGDRLVDAAYAGLLGGLALGIKSHHGPAGADSACRRCRPSATHDLGPTADRCRDRLRHVRSFSPEATGICAT